MPPRSPLPGRGTRRVPRGAGLLARGVREPATASTVQARGVGFLAPLQCGAGAPSPLGSGGGVARLRLLPFAPPSLCRGGGTGEVAHPGVAHPAPGAAPRRVPAGGLRLHLLMTCPPCLLPLCRRTRGRFFPPPPSLGKALRWERSPGRGSAGAAAAARGSARPPAALATGPCFKQASLVQKTLYFTPSLRVGPSPVPPFFNSVFYTVTSFLYEIIPTLNY